MTGGKRRAEAELTGKNGGGNDTRQLACVFAGAGRVSTANTQEIQHSPLRFKDSATANSAYLNGRHRHGDLEVAIVAVWEILVSIPMVKKWRMVRKAYFFIVVIQLLLSTFWAGS